MADDNPAPVSAIQSPPPRCRQNTSIDGALARQPCPDRQAESGKSLDLNQGFIGTITLDPSRGYFSSAFGKPHPGGYPQSELRRAKAAKNVPLREPFGTRDWPSATRRLGTQTRVVAVQFAKQ